MTPSQRKQAEQESPDSHGDIRRRFRAETGFAANIAPKQTGDQAYDMPEVWNGKYVFWLENLSVELQAENNALKAQFDSTLHEYQEAAQDLRKENAELKAEVERLTKHREEMKDTIDAAIQVTARCEELEHELKDAVGLPAVIQEHLTPKLTPVNTAELGQNAFYVRTFLVKGRERCEELEKALLKIVYPEDVDVEFCPVCGVRMENNMHPLLSDCIVLTCQPAKEEGK